MSLTLRMRIAGMKRGRRHTEKIKYIKKSPWARNKEVPKASAQFEPTFEGELRPDAVEIHDKSNPTIIILQLPPERNEE